MTTRLTAFVLITMMALAAGCGRDADPTGPRTAGADKNGTEALGAPDITIAAGTGFVEAGVGMVGVSSGTLAFDVPADAAIAQVLLYWAGGSTSGAGDDAITVDGTSVQGALIGGPTYFFTAGGADYTFSAYRADITGLALVQPGTNSLTVTGFDFDTTGGTIDENNGCSIVVVLDDGTTADLGLVDGLDMAFFGFQPTLDATVPQSFTVTPADIDRTADLLLLVASVGEGRPNRILVTTSAGEQVIDDALGSTDALAWDSLVLPVTVPAGDTSVTVELISAATSDPLGASLGWVAAGLALATPPEPAVDVTGTVYVDADRDGLQGEFEDGIPNVVVDVTDAAGTTVSVVTDAQGHWLFSGPAASYTVVVDTLAHAGTFNEDLRANFAATTPLAVTVTGPVAGVDFGFVPVVEAILEDLDFGELVSVALPREHWVKVFRKAIRAEESGRIANGHDTNDSAGDGWGHEEDFFSADELRELLALIATLYQPEPYVFTPGNELHEAYDLLATRPRGIEAELLRELFVTELNYAANYGLDNEFDRLGVLIGWGETLLVTPLVEDAAKGGSFDKGYVADLGGALRVFEGINTGGGGGIDE